MKPSIHPNARKSPVTLTLNEDLVRQANRLNPNLSGIVEGLLAEFVERESQRRGEQTRQVEATIALWNRFDKEQGGFADDFSTL